MGFRFPGGPRFAEVADQRLTTGPALGGFCRYERRPKVPPSGVSRWLARIPNMLPDSNCWSDEKVRRAVRIDSDASAQKLQR